MELLLESTTAFRSYLYLVPSTVKLESPSHLVVPGKYASPVYSGQLDRWRTSPEPWQTGSHKQNRCRRSGESNKIVRSKVLGPELRANVADGIGQNIDVHIAVSGAGRLDNGVDLADVGVDQGDDSGTLVVVVPDLGQNAVGADLVRPSWQWQLRSEQRSWNPCRCWPRCCRCDRRRRPWRRSSRSGRGRNRWCQA